MEEDYCSPPLAMERRTVLDRYFDNITVEQVESDEEGWNRIKSRPMFWKYIHSFHMPFAVAAMGP